VPNLTAQQLRELRLALGLSQASAAALCGKSYNWVRLLEAGARVADSSREYYERTLLAAQAQWKHKPEPDA
jgi:transcriptional regulator with XRE-family HTH domain